MATKQKQTKTGTKTRKFNLVLISRQRGGGVREIVFVFPAKCRQLARLPMTVKSPRRLSDQRIMRSCFSLGNSTGDRVKKRNIQKRRSNF